VIWGEKAEAVGGRLLISGWWGIGRHLNYTGEIGVYLALTLTTGFHTFIPYLLPLWMLVLLAHRAYRDDRRCRAKYGAAWHAYCAHTHFRMFPFVY
jgi:delta14-sterol reductase